MPVAINHSNPLGSLLINVEGFVDHGFCKTSPNVDVYYALFGSGPIKVMLIMGIATSGLAWKNQIEYFIKHPQYQVCIVDNRGSGRTVTPSGRLTTSEMAADVVALIKHLKWNDLKVHLVGNSLGGMIAQEVALSIPDQLASLTLIATHAGGIGAYVPPFKAMSCMIKGLFVRDTKIQTQHMMETAFSKKHLTKPGRRSSLSIIDEGVEYPTVAEFYADHIKKQFSPIFAKENMVYLFAQQLSAVLTHHVSVDRLKTLRDRFPTLVITGTDDRIVHTSHSRKIADAMDSDFLAFEGAGHAVTEECLDEVNSALHKHFCRAF